MIFKKRAEVSPKSKNHSVKESSLFIGENLIFPTPPLLPGYETAQYFQETFLAYPSHIEPESLFFCRPGSPLRPQINDSGVNQLKNQCTHNLVSKCNSDTSLDALDIESQLNFALHILKDQYQMNPDYYSHSMFSCAVQGKALAILERRSILWMAEPCTVLPETRSLFEAPLPRPPSPWKINLEDYLPKRLAMPYDVSIEVPDSSVYRMCFKCKGNGALEIDTETILCSTCLGLCSLRLSIRLTVYWLPKTIFHSDLNGYTIPERLLSMVDDADPNKYQTLTKYYKNKLLNLLSEIVPAGIRLKQCMFELRVIPLVEIIYCNKKKSKRFIVCGEQRKAAIVLDSKKK